MKRQARTKVNVQAALISAVLIVVVVLSSFCVQMILLHERIESGLELRIQTLSDRLTQDTSLMQDLTSKTFSEQTEQTLRDVGVQHDLSHLALIVMDQASNPYILTQWSLRGAERTSLSDPATAAVRRANAGRAQIATLPDRTNGVYASYLPLRRGSVVRGVLVCEIDATADLHLMSEMLFYSLLIALLGVLLSAVWCHFRFRRVSNLASSDLSNSDQLTQMKNRNSFEMDMNNIIENSAQRGVCIVCLDLNDLKKLNDTYGHDKGDDYLRLAAEGIKAISGKTCVAYRTGGDEFVLLLYRHTFQEAEQTIARLQERMLSAGREAKLPFSIAAGYAVYNEVIDQDLFDTYRRADKNMYDNKLQFKKRQAQAGK